MVFNATFNNNSVNYIVAEIIYIVKYVSFMENQYSWILCVNKSTLRIKRSIMFSLQLLEHHIKIHTF